MKTLSLRNIANALYVTALLTCCGTLPASTQTTAQRPQTESDAFHDIFELNFDENVATPKIPSKQHEAITGYMRKQATDFYKKGYKVETMRNGEVIIITIPTDDLFLPNDSVLLKVAPAKLKPLIPYINQPSRFKTIVMAHSDDTGSESHQQQLTEGRISALYDWFDNNADNTSTLVGYPMGGSEPLRPNNSRINRHDNRRIEIYLVPNSDLVSEAKAGRI